MKRDLLTRLDQDGVVCAEGFLFEIERRGYMASGAFVPEVALDNPHALRALHKDFQHAGSDVVLAFTYNGHREKMRVLGKEKIAAAAQRGRPAKSPAKSPPTCRRARRKICSPATSTTPTFGTRKTKKTRREARGMFDEVCGWAADAGADYIIGETFYYAEEAFEALDAIKQTGLPAVVTVAPMGENKMRDGWEIADTCAELEQRGATVTGMNCFRGPPTMLPYFARDSLAGQVSCRRLAGGVAHHRGASDFFQSSRQQRLRLPCAAWSAFSHGAGADVVQPL